MENRKGIELVIAACETVIKGDRVATMMRRAIEAAEQGDIDAAIGLLKAATDINPMHLDPAVMLGVLLLHDKSQQIPAMACFNKAITQDPNNALPLWYLSCDKLRCGRTTEAVTFLNTAAECQPVDSYAVLTLAWVLRMLGNLSAAKAMVESKLLANQVRYICPTLELLLEFQEIELNYEIIGDLFGKNTSCIIDLGCVADSKGHDERLLSAILCNSDQRLISNNMPGQDPGCIHVDNQAIDSYKHRYGEQVVKRYAGTFLKEIFVPEIKRLFSKNNLRKQRSPKGHKQLYTDMVLVPAGQYTVGCNLQPLQHPERKCVIPTFLIDKYPVTNRQWCEFQPNHPFPKEFENNPVTNVDFIQATMYARWKGKRLPTEVEWEAAARGPQAFRYPWGQTPEQRRANCADRNLRRTTAVTQHPQGAAPCGALDMLGNTLEWVDDWGPSMNGQLGTRVVKGGSFSLRMADLACWLRSFFSPITKGPNLGFRCAKDL